MYSIRLFKLIFKIQLLTLVIISILINTIPVFGNDYDFRIVGGDSVTDYDKYPAVVSIAYDNPDSSLAVNHWCGGTIITPDWVLTAAHCAEKYPIDSLLFIIGTTILSDTSEAEVLTADGVYIHEKLTYPPDTTHFNWAHGNDIALFHLSDPCTSCTYCPINYDSLLIEPSDSVISVGWGNFNNSDPDTLQEASFEVLHNDTCTTWIRGLYYELEIEEWENFSAQNHVCVLDTTGEQSITGGDSGGPLFVYDSDNHLHSTGIASYVYIGLQNPYSDHNVMMYTSIEPFSSWIDSIVQSYNISFANKEIGETATLVGSLQIDNFNWNITSGDSITVPPLSESAPAWTVRTQNEVIDDSLKHYLWNNQNSQYLMHHDIVFTGDGSDYARFKGFDEVVIKTNIPDYPDVLSLWDPWYVDSAGVQPDELIPLEALTADTSYNVFLNQNEYFVSVIPIYELCANENYADTSAIFEFDHWGGNNVNYGTQNTSNLCIEIVFEEPGATGEAIYDTISYNNVLTLDEDLTIPAGAEYQFGSSFRIDVENGATLTFAGTVDNPINLLPQDSSGWGGIRLLDSSNVQLQYTKIIKAEIGLDIQSSIDSLNNIVNNSFGFCDTAIMIRHDDFDDLEITNNIFHQNDVAIDLDFYDGSSTGVGDDLIIQNSIFYDNTTTYIDVHDCTSNCYSSSGLLYENPDLKDVDEATEKYDCTLQWVSPCINGGASGMTADPDNTVIDIGAYYFHITLGDLNADSDWNVLDINTMTAYIMNPDPATPTSTMEDIGDLTDDTDVDVLDVVALVDCIQGDGCDELERSTPPSGSANLLAYQPESLDRSDGAAIVISINSDVPVYGIQFDLEFETSEYSLIDVELTDITDGFELEYRDYGNGTVRVLSYSLEAESIPTGINEVLVMNLNGLERGESNVIYTVVNAKVSDEHGNNLLLSGNDPANTAVPTAFALHQAYPNPFNPETTVRYDLPVEADVNITVYDIMGRPVTALVNNHMSPGYHRVTWNAKNNASGVYFIKLQTPKYTNTQKVMLVK